MGPCKASSCSCACAAKIEGEIIRESITEIAGELCVDKHEAVTCGCIDAPALCGSNVVGDLGVDCLDVCNHWPSPNILVHLR